MRRFILISILAIVALAAIAAVAIAERADLNDYAAYFEEPAGEGASREGRVTVKFLGVATVVVSDGETTLMTDGFFSRPSLAAVLAGEIEPDLEQIGRALERAGIDGVDVVATVHSHYDHAMDSPEVARRTGAILLGSESTANIGRGWGLDEAQIVVAESGRAYPFGKFNLTLIRSKHAEVPTNRGIAGEISEPLVPPVKASAYQEGGAYSVLIEHPAGTVLVQGSAGYVEGALDDRHADVVFLGVGGLGNKSDEEREAYYREIVEATGGRWVIPIHYDDFFLSLDEPLKPMRNVIDDFDATMQFLIERVGREGQDGATRLGLMRLWDEIVLFGPGSPLAGAEEPGLDASLADADPQ